MRRNVRMVLEDVLGEDVSGKAQKEVEHVFYGKISDPKQLDELSKQPFVTKHLQEQSQCTIPGRGQERGDTLRVRRVNRDKSVLTRKAFVPGQPGMDEKTLEVGEGLFEFLSSAFGECVAKMRYTIKPEGYDHPLELDVFLNAQGLPTGYAKFDYEVTSPEDTPPPLPLNLTDLKHVNPYRSTDEERAHLREFMQSQSYRL